MVSTNPPRRFKIEIFRTGYYGGRGARLMTTLGPVRGQAAADSQPGPRRTCTSAGGKPARPSDDPRRLAQRRLSRPAHDAARSRRAEPYWQSYVVFIVRDDRPADILFQCTDNTWQAYNRWPDNYSLYTHPEGGPGPVGRRQLRPALRPRGPVRGIVNDPLSVGSGEFLPLEFPLAYWLEQHGYDVTYCSNSDMLTPDHGLKCKAFISVGHDEYWDIRQYQQRREDARRRREPAVPLRQLRLLGHPASRQQRRPARTGSSSAAAPTAPRTSTPSAARRSTARSPSTGRTRASSWAAATSTRSTAAATGSAPSRSTGSSRAPA